MVSLNFIDLKFVFRCFPKVMFRYDDYVIEYAKVAYYYYAIEYAKVAIFNNFLSIPKLYFGFRPFFNVYIQGVHQNDLALKLKQRKQLLIKL